MFNRWCSTHHYEQVIYTNNHPYLKYVESHRCTNNQHSTTSNKNVRKKTPRSQILLLVHLGDNRWTNFKSSFFKTRFFKKRNKTKKWKTNVKGKPKKIVYTCSYFKCFTANTFGHFEIMILL